MSLFTLPRQVPVQGGNTFAGALAYFYQAGTTTPETVYSNAALTIPHSNPVVADANGVFPPIYTDDTKSYRFRLTTATGQALGNDVDPYPGNAFDGAIEAKVSQAYIGATLYPRTAAEITAGVTPTDYAYPQMNVLRYGADRTGVASSTVAFNRARSVQVAHRGGEIVVPSGLYRVNLTITGENAKYRAEDDFYENSGTVGLIADNAALPVLQLGDGTTQSRNMRFNGFAVLGTGGATKGIRVYGADRVKFHNLSVRGFSEYQIQLDSSAARPSFFVYFTEMDLATAGVTGSLGIDFNYGGSYVTGVYIDNSTLNAATGGGHLLDMEDFCQARVTNTWFNAKDLNGIRIRGATTRLYGASVTVDSSSSAHVLVEVDFNAFLPQVIRGDVTIDGVVRMPDGDTPAQSERVYIPRRALARDLHIQTGLHFNRADLDQHLQHELTDQPQRITLSSNKMLVRSTDGEIELRTSDSGKVTILRDSGTAAVPLAFGAGGPLITAGAGTPEGAVTAPIGSLFLRTDGSTGTSVYVKESGAGNTGWVAK